MKLLLDTNLIYIFNLDKIAPTLIPSNIQNLASIKKNILKTDLYISEISLIEIITTDKSNRDKEILLSWIIDNKIKILPIIFDYDFSTKLDLFFSQSNLEKKIIKSNIYEIRKKDNFINYSWSISSIVAEKKKMEIEFFRVFLLIFNTFILKILDNKIETELKRNKVPALVKKFKKNILCKEIYEIFDSSLDNIKNEFDIIITSYYATRDFTTLSKKLTGLIFSYIDKIFFVYNSVADNSIIFLKYQKDIKELSIKDISYLKKKTVKIDGKYMKKVSTMIKNGNSPEPLSNVLGDYKFKSIEKYTIKNLRDSCPRKIIKYYMNFIIRYFNNSGIKVNSKNKNTIKPGLIDKNNMFDSLLLQHETKYFIISNDISFNTICSSFCFVNSIINSILLYQKLTVYPKKYFTNKK